MKNKVVYAFVAIVLLAGLVLSACTPKPTAAAEQKNEPVQLKMTIWGSSSDPEVYRTRLDLFEAKNPTIKVELVYIPSDYAQKVQTMIAGGTSPDIIQLAEDVHGYSSKGQILPLNDYVTKYNVNLNERFGTGGLVAAYSRDGKLYAMPDRGGALILYYNKAMFDAAGLSYPTKDWTWTEFLDAAQKLTIREGDQVKQYGFAAGDWWPWWMSFIYQNGGQVLDANGKPALDTPETVEALQFYVDLVYKYKVAPSPTDYANLGTNSPDPLFAQGKVAMITTGFWNVGSLQQVPDLKWDIAPLFKQKKSATVMFGSGLAISKDSKHPEEAFKVIEFLTSEEGQMPIVEMKQDMPANLKVLASDTFKNTAWSATPIRMETMLESAQMALPLPIAPQWNEMQKVFGDNLAEVFLGKAEVAPAVKSIQQELEQLLK